MLVAQAPGNGVVVSGGERWCGGEEWWRRVVAKSGSGACGIEVKSGGEL